ncbi:MAG: alpha/beta fold hydrolase [Myxococcales bacterium]|nr:alpha/beta fold hydrolase [Polyangiaceae bacterium]MDW8248479.1 alpha/beta fold hydrolase [Myxococcales bacterium]
MTRWSLLACPLLLACKSDPPTPSPHPPIISLRTTSSAVVSATLGPTASAPAEPRPRVIPVEQVIAFSGAGGVTLAASWYQASSEAPVVVFLHRLGGQRSEWQPLIRKLLKEGPELSLLTLDLRGHGQSSASEGRVGGSLQKRDIEQIPEDLKALVGEVDRRLGQKASSLIGVGADLGATVLVLAASQEPRWSTLGLLAPVAGLRGVDLYRPFAEVRRRPIWLAVAREDPVSLEPFKAMTSMVGATITSKQYEGQDHNITRLAASTPVLWDDLAGWIVSSTNSLSAQPASAQSAGGEK